jgi:hypothetical protein
VEPFSPVVEPPVVPVSDELSPVVGVSVEGVSVEVPSPVPVEEPVVSPVEGVSAGVSVDGVVVSPEVEPLVLGVSVVVEDP